MVGRFLSQKPRRFARDIKNDSMQFVAIRRPSVATAVTRTLLLLALCRLITGFVTAYDNLYYC